MTLSTEDLTKIATLKFSYIWESYPGFPGFIDYTFNLQLGELDNDDITYNYELSEGVAENVTVVTVAQALAFKETIKQWEAVADVTFYENTSPSSSFTGLIINQAILTSASADGLHVPGTIDDGKMNASDLFISRYFSAGQFNTGEIGWRVFMHEIGHALGLDDVSALEYSKSASIMSSYNLNNFLPLTPMLYDIKAVQDKYGVNTHTNSGDTTYTVFSNGTVDATNDGGTDNVNGGHHTYGVAWFDTLATIWDAGGLDTVDASDFSSSGVIINLDEGIDKYNDANGFEFYWAFGSNIENVIGGDGNDFIYGNALNNEFSGGDGLDTFDGSDGIDTISYNYITSGGVRVDVYVDEGESEAGSSDQDGFIHIEKIIGTDQVDTIKSLIELEGKTTKVTAGDDIDGQYLEIHAPGMPSTGIKVYDFEKLELGGGTNIIKLNLSENSTLQEISIDSPTSTSRNEIDISGGQPGHTGLNIYLAAGNDVIRNVPAGSRIQTGDGNDIIQLMDKVLITDASTSDRLYYAETELHGAIRSKNSDLSYVSDGNNVRYYINQDGELVVQNPFGSETFISNYQQDYFTPPTAGITLAEFSAIGFRLLQGPGDFKNSVSIFTAMGIVIKALTGHNPFTGLDPIVLDLDGDGLELTARTSVSQLFDLDANQFAVTSGWVRGDDGFLARDMNSNGIIDDGSELVGNRTMEGFDALALLDTNSDGHITSADSTFSSFRIWRDLNGNGVTDSGELQTLTEAGITSIDVTATNTTETDNAGNRILGTASFTRSDSSTGTVASVDFSVNRRDTVWTGNDTVSTEAQALPDLKGYGTLPSLHISMTLDTNLLDTVETVLPTLDTNNLETLRTDITPILTAWMASVSITAADAGYEAREDVAVLAANDNVAVVINERGTKLLAA